MSFRVALAGHNYRVSRQYVKLDIVAGKLQVFVRPVELYLLPVGTTVPVYPVRGNLARVTHR